MYSRVINGEVFDYRFKKIESGVYSFYLVGDTKEIIVGSISKDGLGWTCVLIADMDNLGSICASVDDRYFSLCPIHGLKTRLAAAELLMKLLEHMFGLIKSN